MSYILIYIFFLNSSIKADDVSCTDIKTINTFDTNISEIKKTVESTVPMTIVNSTDNTYKKNGSWRSTMGPLSNRKYGLACDNTVRDMRYHTGEYSHWFIAPSDSFTALGMKKCKKSSNGEPGCSENWSMCGRKVRVNCNDSTWCGRAGEETLVSQINRSVPPVNKYLPAVFVEELSMKLGSAPKVPKSIVLYITDFCPADHSSNIKNGQCQGPQVDISTSAFLLMGKTNKQGYINTNTSLSVELLEANDPSPIGPSY
jgi:hypothetical protein